MYPTTARILDGRPRDLGGFSVRRILPAGGLQTVGPFIFFDHLGPATFAPGTGIDVRPHPHIGLATVTYLYEGELLHRDSLEHLQVIRPGDVNWMTAGRGIVHSERTPPAPRASGHQIHAIQSWVALPKTHEEVPPSFHHHPAATLPLVERDGVMLRLIAGTAFGRESPVHALSTLFYVDALLPAGSALLLPPEHEERAVYVSEGELDCDGQRVTAGQMFVAAAGTDLSLAARQTTRAMLLGGAPLDGPRYLWWNFVASSRDRLERAKLDWREQRFGVVPGEREYIPLPDA